MDEAEKDRHEHPLPRYWVAEADSDRAWGSRKPAGPHFAWRGIARTSDVRTAIGTIMPTSLPGGGNFDMVLGAPRGQLASFAAAFSSFVFDFAARQKLSNMHLQFSVVKQLPLPSPSAYANVGIPLDRPLASWLELRVDRLNGWIADPDERARVRAELDALMFHVYGLGRDDVSYVLDTFPIVKRKDEAAFGSYRTKELILAAYDALGEAEASGTSYRAPWNQEVHA
ncbi:hypothetical protein [Tessaracoccus palaemonis]|uniref:Site-specific DNA-methyltransferase (adenine-specific) n=1 Tax=Tessaracoccus palaemonis TaxID=2829499 RepID=A0ABX8SL41_9ACTN|nr:hypothetical protein [Tessaracoccus palaemonis]QXT62883.1 hypothetical protein KDB89_14340 [Tessaracoccus palaemonis]